MNRGYYELLGLKKEAADKEIKAQYRKLARKYHPDANPGDKDAELRFKELNEAYQVLSDPKKRRYYDKFGPQWEQMMQAGIDPDQPRAWGGANDGPGGFRVEYGTPEGLDLDDILGGMMGGFGGFEGFGGFKGASRRQKAQPAKGSDIEAGLELTLEEAELGTVRTFSFDAGAGSRRIEVTIPKGTRDGAKLKLKGQGAKGPAGPGDLYLKVTVAPHALFVPSGDDLRMDLEIPVEDAVLGGEAKVPLLGGRFATLKVPEATQNGKLFRLKGEGLSKKGGGKGDLYARIKVVLPERATEQVKRAFEELRRANRP
ncbi:MAG TPA: DnaJ C-terminal domain-containing protein [Bacillota bacterium]|nr:MAG: Curved DNA-binding protein [Firmicutes bacterium ADurb.Bin153]HNV34772.1 DnaJ C-terminal domain-containing protein [Bacillota bacterium]